MVMILNEAQQKEISSAIAGVERDTDAELVTVLAKRADDYYYIPTLWAAVVALLLPILIKFTPLWLTGDELLLMQWTVFIVLAVVFHIPFIMMKLVPRKVRYWRASNLARRQFLENNLHHTKNGMGVLIFVSEAEHYVEIIADQGISQHVSNDEWQEIINAFVGKVKAGQTKEGFLNCISSCGALLKQHAPASEEKNELPNHLIVLQ
jgi:putative membrane protein